MPWRIEHRDDSYCVVQEDTDETVHCHETRADAEAQMRALYANEPDAGKGQTGMMEHKSFDSQVRIESADEGVVRALVSVFDVEDSDGDIVHPGAFTKSIKWWQETKGRYPAGVWHHDWTAPIALTKEMNETPQGLEVLAEFNLETQRGRESFSDIKKGIVSEYSFGFEPVEAPKREGKERGRDLKEMRIFEWSPVLIGANRSTYTVGVKRATLPAGVPFEEQLDALLADANGCVTRQREINALRQQTKRGAVYSAARLQRLKEVRELLDVLIAEGEPAPDTTDTEGLRTHFLRRQTEWQRLMAGVD